MKRWIRWAGWLYPAEWRMRYGAEFDIFLDDAPLRWRDLGDVIRGAVLMQMTSWMTYWKMALLAGIAGAIIAGGISFAIPDQWVCTAALMIDSPGATQGHLQQALNEAAARTLGRDSLVNLIKDPGLGLYRNELQRATVLDVAEEVFRKHVHVIPYASFGVSGQAFRIVFSYPDRYKAHSVVERLTEAFQEEPFRSFDGLKFSVLEQPVLPEMPTSPYRPAYVILGSIAGILTGLLSLAIFRRTRVYAVVTMSIPKDTKRFVDSQIASGPYRSVSDYVRELIRADEQRHK